MAGDVLWPRRTLSNMSWHFSCPCVQKECVLLIYLWGIHVQYAQDICYRVRKKGLLKKASFQKSSFSREPKGFRLKNVEILENCQTVGNKGESDFLEILEELEILEIPPVKRPRSKLLLFRLRCSTGMPGGNELACAPIAPGRAPSGNNNDTREVIFRNAQPCPSFP